MNERELPCYMYLSLDCNAECQLYPYIEEAYQCFADSQSITLPEYTNTLRNNFECLPEKYKVRVIMGRINELEEGGGNRNECLNFAKRNNIESES